MLRALVLLLDQAPLRWNEVVLAVRIRGYPQIEGVAAIVVPQIEGVAAVVVVVPQLLQAVLLLELLQEPTVMLLLLLLLPFVVPSFTEVLVCTPESASSRLQVTGAMGCL
jgi:hypothetical protein